MKGLSHSFTGFNRNRKSPGTNISRMVNRVINTNEMSPHGRRLLRNFPHAFGPQFLRVNILREDGNDPDDQIDLKTGNWAKIDPEGFFPD
jgi:hypothetical protein